MHYNDYFCQCFYIGEQIMNIDVDDFFVEFNSVEDITDEDYKKADTIVRIAKAFTRSMSQGIYIVDYFKRNFLYVSDRMSSWCGLSSDKIQELGYKFYLDYVPSEEQQMLLEIHREGFRKYSEIPLDERLEYSIFYDFHIRYNGKTHLINHQFTPVMLTRHGWIWLALCTISMSARSAPGYIIMKRSGLKYHYEYSLDQHLWIRKESTMLNNKEREMLLLSAQGYTMNDIANKLCYSIDTIKACRKEIFLKMKVRNIAEALLYANNYRLL